ncbi:HAD-IIIC family phosphatase [Steroidobacter cummioxidans]|uniref:HAD-IIIC family phosphatase n=1 Tax=Steroidobacter cummioxidans TaxID=1803913 RepID=UPI000E30CCCF|nr:HAD-IIIC family phosphatase [Steroidobacter cummioxidans]
MEDIVVAHLQNQTVSPQGLLGRDPLTLSAGDVRRFARELTQASGEPHVRIAFGGNVTFDPLPEYVLVHLACAGLVPVFHAIEFGQVTQTLLDPHSQLHCFKPDLIFLHWELEHGIAGHEQRRAFVDSVCATVATALASTDATILLSNFFDHGDDGAGLADWRGEPDPQELFAELNRNIAKQFRFEPRVQLVDIARLTAQFGRSRARDLRLYLLARIPWHESFMPLLADELTRHIKVALGRVRKCLVVDLDNTLWAGVLGEDGPRGVRVGKGDATSEAHYRLQQKLLVIKQRGILLAACSKNNPEDVAELFRIRTDMPLRAEDFVCMRIGWDSKDQGLQHIAAELNIGTDSLVFLDDNPAEIELIRRALPEVECVLLPQDSALSVSCLDRIHSLDRALITHEDWDKSAHYRQGSAREAARRQFVELPEYLRSLETTIELQPLSRDLVARAHQLFMKTNQFNATGRRYGLGELQRCVDDASRIAVMVHAKDRFGDLGWIAAAILSRSQEPCAHLDNLVISCRALGRGLEVALLNSLKLICFELYPLEYLTAEYRPSKKNSPVSEVFPRAGFVLITPGDADIRRYQLSRDRSLYAPCDWIRVRARNLRALQGTAYSPSQWEDGPLSFSSNLGLE